MLETHIAWVAGIIEGEGSFLTRNSGVSVTVTMTDFDVLERLSEYCGGHIYKLNKRCDRWSQAWKWQLCGIDAYNLTMLVLPYLLSRRSSQAEILLDRYRRSKGYQSKVLRTKVRILRATGLSHRRIADECGVSRTYVSHILGKRYKCELGVA